MSKHDPEVLALLGDDTATDDLVTSSELAEWLGLSASRINELAREGVVPRERLPLGVRYPLRASVYGYCEHIRSGTGRRAADPDLAAAKLALAEANAEKVELQNAQKRGDLLDAQLVRAEWISVAADLRARLLAVPSRVAARLGLDRPSAAALDKEIRRALTDLSDGVEDDE